MPLRRLCVAVLGVVMPAVAFAGHPKPCLTADEGSRMVDKDICVAAHVYDEVQLSDGTRYLDICAPETPDEMCQFTIVRLWEDHEEVGDLSGFRNRDVHIRGRIRPMHGRAGIVLSHVRQFNGGPPKFRPNPRLAHGFNGEQDRPPVSDPALRPHGGRRAFMNTRNQETLSGK